MDIVKEMDPKLKVFIWPITTIAVSLTVLGAVIIPQLLEYGKAAEEIRTIEGKIAAIEKKTDALQGYNDEQLKNELSVVLTILPYDQEVPEAVTLLQSVANSANLVIRGAKYTSNNFGGAKPAPGKTSGSSYTITLTTLGSNLAIQDFIDKVKQAPKSFQIDMINLSTPRGESVTQTDITMVVQFMPDSKVTLTETSQLPVLSGPEKELLKKLTGMLSGGATNPEQGLVVPMGKSNPFE